MVHLLTHFLGLVLICSASLAIRERRQIQYCVTPDNFRGTCQTLTNCQYLRLLYLQYGGSNQFRQYFFNSQNACNNVVVGRDPVVCCNQNNAAVEEEQTPRPVVTTTTARPTTPSTPVNGVCRGPDGVQGNCISLRDCSSLLNQLQANPSNTQFAQFLRQSNAACAQPSPIVCCPSSQSNSNGGQTSAPSGGAIVNDRLPTPEEGCGVVANQFFKKVVGGQPAKPGDWPWIALLGYVETNGMSSFKCGGALISSKHILTAAHCLRSNLKFVRLGENDLTKETETEHMDIEINKSFMHPKYDRRDGHSDIAVLRLSQSAPYTNFIRYICLPSDPPLRSKSYVNLNPFVAGWGKTEEGGKSANILQEIQVPVHRNEECITRYSNEGRYISTKQFDDAVICAGVLAGGVDTCQGDSGGPLVQPEINPRDKTKLNYYQIGVVSYGIGCARPSIPGVYTNVPRFIDWINEKIRDTTA